MVVAKSPARGQSPNKRKTVQSKRRRRGYDVRREWVNRKEGRREETVGVGIKGESQRGVRRRKQKGAISLRGLEVLEKHL